MKNIESVKQRYLRDPLPIRLGGLAANLARLSSFIENPNNRKVISYLIKESEFFIEWIAPETDSETQLKLIALQLQLALWYNNFNAASMTENERQQIIQQSKKWVAELLPLSGLL